jgi:DNA polymerase/3'-5' exonuclease PolX
MSEMVERVARAMYGEIDFRGEAYKKARAAIEAMREPTEQMSTAGELTPFDCHSDVTWRAMIDAALGVSECPERQQLREEG